ncbi:MAG TPA: DUF5597 domain-containing protein [Phnomibacter sp.]|nr:DUF5597 domain-containing protein [Phnomibacter sp.]
MKSDQLIMNYFRIQKMLLVIVAACSVIFCTAQKSNTPPHIEKINGHGQLIVQQKPFTILGGELGNSTASSLEEMRRHWPTLQQMGLNTVLAPVYWELLEPEENKFDFSLVDGLIADARKYNLKLVFLWFGTWKNSMSSYAPVWMKTNPARFPRTQDKQKNSQEIFSVFGKETLEADKKAFARLMRHIRETDEQQNTVIMMQVENEIGMLPTSREFSAIADQQFNSNIPNALSSYLQKNATELVPELQQQLKKQGGKKSGTWAQVFGEGLSTDEIFQAWYYAGYTNEVTKAGKKEYNLPMFVNAALPRPGKLPGEYPSAGPLPHLMNIWNAAAPDIDMLSPDFYNPDTKYWCNLYDRMGNTIFVPEMQFDISCAAKAFYIIGHHQAIGFSPFSIESDNAGATPLSKTYAVLHQLLPTIHRKEWLKMDGFLFDKGNEVQQADFGQVRMSVSHAYSLPWMGNKTDTLWPATGGIILQTAPDEFLVAGTGIVVTFASTDSNYVYNIASADEIIFKNGKPEKQRRLNGDQTHQGRHVRIDFEEWGIQQVKLYRSPRSIASK